MATRGLRSCIYLMQRVIVGCILWVGYCAQRWKKVGLRLFGKNGCSRGCHACFIMLL
jgi:hypothetical protein